MTDKDTASSALKFGFEHNLFKKVDKDNPNPLRSGNLPTFRRPKDAEMDEVDLYERDYVKTGIKRIGIYQDGRSGPPDKRIGWRDWVFDLEVLLRKLTQYLPAKIRMKVRSRLGIAPRWHTTTNAWECFNQPLALVNILGGPENVRLMKYENKPAINFIRQELDKVLIKTRKKFGPLL